MTIGSKLSDHYSTWLPIICYRFECSRLSTHLDTTSPTTHLQTTTALIFPTAQNGYISAFITSPSHVHAFTPVNPSFSTTLSLDLPMVESKIPTLFTTLA
jgi:hypothetical protein